MRTLSLWTRHVVLVIAAAAIAPSAQASFHGFAIEQVYSNADGTVQFVVMHEKLNLNGEQFLTNQQFKSTHAGNTKTFTFPSNLPSSNTAGRRFLMASDGFAALGILAPNYVFPNGFLATDGGTLNFANVDSFTYAALPTDGTNALSRNGSIVPNVATNFAGNSASVVPPVVTFGNVQGLWWNVPPGSEAGWGINFAHQGDTIFATWFTYGLDGKQLWLVVVANKVADKVYSGTLLRISGPPFNSAPFDPALVTETAVGTAILTFTDNTHATFAYNVEGIVQTKTITRQEFGAPIPACAWGGQPNLALATNYQDLWWRSPPGSESGWGINFTHQGDTIFATWFTYGLDGKPMWLAVSANRTAPGVYTGDLFTTTGPAFNAVPFNPANVVETTVGAATLTFSDGNTATFAYTVNGEAQVKTITRQVFAEPGTVCQ